MSTIASPIPETVKKQGADYLIEIDGKTLSLYGQGALKHFLTVLGIQARPVGQGPFRAPVLGDVLVCTKNF